MDYSHLIIKDPVKAQIFKGHFLMAGFKMLSPGMLEKIIGPAGTYKLFEGLVQRGLACIYAGFYCFNIHFVGAYLRAALWLVEKIISPQHIGCVIFYINMCFIL